jgi:hypothetical protein
MQGREVLYGGKQVPGLAQTCGSGALPSLDLWMNQQLCATIMP